MFPISDHQNWRSAMPVGWSLGGFEAGLVYSLKQEVVEDSMFLVVGALAPMVIYGLLLGLIGKLADMAKLRIPWTFVWLGGLVSLFLLRAWGGLNPVNWSWAGNTMGVNWLWAIPGTLFASLIWWKSHLLSSRIVRSVGWLSFFFIPAFWLVFALRGDIAAVGTGPDIEPQDMSAPNVVLITWDTVRADTLPLYGGGGLDTPNLDRLAGESFVFDNIHAVASITAPAHASILSGLYPPTHGLRSNGLTSPELPTPRLPRILADAGYAVGAFVSGYSLRGVFGFDRDFQVYDYRPVADPTTSLLAGVAFSSKLAERLLPGDLMHNSKYIPGEVTLQRATDWLAGTADRPAFLWAHFFDAHHPYNPPEELRSRALNRSAEGPHAVDPEVEHELVMQRAEIERLDALLGQLLEQLEKKDPGLNNTVIALVADHGECFGEGGHVLNHHYSLFDATQKIVCVIRPAGGVESTRISIIGSQIDLMPTLLEMSGHPVPADLHGRNLLAAPGQERGIYMEAFQRNLGENRMHGWLKGGWKFVRTLGGEEHLYRSGEGLESDLIDQNPEIADELREELEQFLATVVFNQGADNQTQIDRLLLEGLGYADTEEDE